MHTGGFCVEMEKGLDVCKNLSYRDYGICDLLISNKIFFIMSDDTERKIICFGKELQWFSKLINESPNLSTVLLPHMLSIEVISYYIWWPLTILNTIAHKLTWCEYETFCLISQTEKVSWEADRIQIVVGFPSENTESHHLTCGEEQQL